MIVEFNSMADRCIREYSRDSDLPLPYQKLRLMLLDGDIDGFIEQLKGILSGIPSTIRRKKYDEAYFHISAHSILKVLGFVPSSEDTTNIGRIDMAIKLQD